MYTMWPRLRSGWINPAWILPPIALPIICSHDDQKKRAGEVIQANSASRSASTPPSRIWTWLLTCLPLRKAITQRAIGGYTSSSLVWVMWWVYYHSSSINASNKTRLNNAEVDALIDKATDHH